MAKKKKGRGARIVRDAKAGKLKGKDKDKAAPEAIEVNFGNVEGTKIRMLAAINKNIGALRQEMKGYFNG